MPFGLPGVGIWSMDASYSTLSLLLSSRSEEVSPAAVPSRMPSEDEGHSGPSRSADRQPGIVDQG